jgi:hypothetical protein
MPGQSIAHTRRQLGRAEGTAKAALAAPANEQLALKALAPGMLTQCEAYACDWHVQRTGGESPNQGA